MARSPQVGSCRDLICGGKACGSCASRAFPIAGRRCITRAIGRRPSFHERGMLLGGLKEAAQDRTRGLVGRRHWTIQTLGQPGSGSVQRRLKDDAHSGVLPSDMPHVVLRIVWSWGVVIGQEDRGLGKLHAAESNGYTITGRCSSKYEYIFADCDT